MTTTDRWRVAIFSVLLVMAAGIVGLVVWWGAPHLKNVRNGLRWQKEMRAVVARRAQIEAEWNRQFGPLDEFPKRHPATEANETAKKLDVELAAMDMDGIINTHPVQPAIEIGEVFNSVSAPETHPKHYDARSAAVDRANAEVSKRRKEASEQVTNYLNAQMEQPDDVITAPSPAIAAYIHSKADGLAKIRTLLAGNEAPVWRADYSHSSAPIVNLLGFLRLNRLLAVEGYLAMHAGDPITASNDLNAMSVLNQACARRPEMVSMLVALASERYRLAAARMLASIASEAQRTIEIFDANAMLREAYIGEVWRSDLESHEIRDEQLKKMASHPIARYLPPPDNYMLDAWRLDYLRAMTAMIPRMIQADECNKPAMMPQDAKPEEWNIIALIAIPNLDSIPRRVQRLEMESEMTRKVVQLAQARAAAVTGELKLPADFADSGCKAGHWLVEKSTDGRSITLRFSTPIDWGEKLKGPHIPLQYTLHQPVPPMPASSRR